MDEEENRAQKAPENVPTIWITRTTDLKGSTGYVNSFKLVIEVLNKLLASSEGSGSMHSRVYISGSCSIPLL